MPAGRPPPQLTRYQVLGRIAVGGMAEVWLARTSAITGREQLVVLKTILPSLSQSREFVQMFVNEARVAARLAHPNCVQIFDLGKEGETLFIAMQYIDGFALSRVIERSRSRSELVPLDVLARVACDALAGLEHAHHLHDDKGRHVGIIHRDVSPENLLVGFDGSTRLVDFGIAKARDSAQHVSKTGTVKGKLGYIAPEYILDQPVDGRADLFALGVVLYRALTGRRAFNGADAGAAAMAVVRDTPPPPHLANPAVPVAVSNLVMRALQKSPDARYASAAHMREALEQATRPATRQQVGALLEELWPVEDRERAALEVLATGRANASGAPALAHLDDDEGEGLRLSSLEPDSGIVASAAAPAPPTRPSRPAAALLPPRASRPLFEDLPPTVGARPSVVGLAEVAPVLQAFSEAADLPTSPSRPMLPDLPPSGRPSAPRRSPDGLPRRTSKPALGASGNGHSGTEPLPSAWEVPPLEPAEKTEVSGSKARPPPTVARRRPRRWLAWAGAAALIAAAFSAGWYRAMRAAPGRVAVNVGQAVTVFAGKAELGPAPGTFTLAAGPQTLRLVSAEAGIDQTFPVEVKPGEGLTLNGPLRTGTLTVQCSTPAVAKLDGRPIGTAPFARREVFEGTHVLELYSAGLKVGKRLEVKVASGEAKAVTVQLSEGRR